MLDPNDLGKSIAKKLEIVHWATRLIEGNPAKYYFHWTDPKKTVHMFLASNLEEAREKLEKIKKTS